ncbi:MAG: tetratricopeptide repeat protein [Chitinispirillaceae bacterium]
MSRAFLLFSLAVVIQANAFEVPSDHSSFAERITTDIINCEFEKTIKATDSAVTSDPQNSLAAVLHLVALGMRDVDYDSTIDAAAFQKSFERATKSVEKYEKAHGATSYSRTLKGFVLAIHASFYLKKDEYFAAYGTGMDAIDIMNKARELDSTNTEVNLFLGLYEYAKGDLKRKLWWVLFWYPGDKERGIKQLEQCARSAQMTATAAQLALSDIYLKQKKPERSKKIISTLKKKFPRSRFLLWSEAKYLEEQKQYQKAAKVYGKLADSYAKEPKGSFNSLITRNKQAHLLNKAGQKQLAINVCKNILEQRGNKRTRDVMKDTKKLLERLNDNS